MGILSNFLFHKSILSYIRELTTDDTGRLSLAKNVLFFGFISATAICWKLVLMGGFGIEYFVTYLALCSGQHLTSKWIDTKGSKETN